MSIEVIKNISVIFISIFLESLPFLFLGSLISAVIENFISDEQMAKIFPRNIFLGSIVGIFLGIFLPACDCAVIPISKRLVKKKVPINVATAFMLASPIINPIVLLSSYYAFYNSYPKIFYLRFILGILISLAISIIMGLLFRDSVIKDSNELNHHHNQVGGFKNNIINIIYHASNDLYDILKYLIIGSIIASVMQTLIPESIISVFQNNNILSIFILMIFAYLISLCSTSDSFVGKSLINSFSKASVLSYLLLGPMIDIKNTIVLLGNYERKFVVILIFFIFFFIFLASFILGVSI